VATFVLIHGGGGTASGWSLVASGLTERGHDDMPRTMLRYSIEHLDKEERGEYMDMKKVGETKKREENE
jgi:hypothetical protein